MKLPYFLTTYRTRINAVLDKCLSPTTTEPIPLHQAMRYSVLGGGKRLRAMLIYAMGEAFGADLDSLDYAAASVELVHACSLIHDDLPAMDNDDLRHGQPTCHRVYGDATAILAGDALQGLAIEVLARPHPRVLATQHLLMLETLGRAIGSLGMVGGQVLDLAAEGQMISSAALDTIHRKKTGALIMASVQLGALAANCQDAAQLQILGAFADKLGLAFQIRDDILDIQSSTEILGKTQGADSARHKATYPAILGLEASKCRAQQLYEESLACLAQAGIASLGLTALAEFVVKRDR